jgi:hypothetical protein
VAEDTWGGMGSRGDLLKVGAADAARMDPNQHLTWANGRDGDGLESDVVKAAVDGGLHGRWDGRYVDLGRTRPGLGHKFR